MNRDSKPSFSLEFSQLESIKEYQEVVNFVSGSFDYEFLGFDENRSRHKNDPHTMKKLRQKHAKDHKKKESGSKKRGSNSSASKAPAKRRRIFEAIFRDELPKIDGQQVIVEKVGGNQETREDLAKSLPPSECCYVVFYYDFTTNENVQKSKIFFIAWSPKAARVRSKMLYASSKDRFRREFDGVHVELQATDPSEISLDTFIGRAL